MNYKIEKIEGNDLMDELIKNDYSDDNQSLFLYVKTIDI